MIYIIIKDYSEKNIKKHYLEIYERFKNKYNDIIIDDDSYAYFKEDYIKNNKTFQNCRIIVRCQSCGKKIYRSWNNSKRKEKCFCKNCGLSNAWKSRIYSLETVIEIVNKNGYVVKYEENIDFWNSQDCVPTSKLVIGHCIDCNETYESKWEPMKRKRGRRKCNKCLGVDAAKRNSVNGITYEQMKQDIESYNNCILLTTKEEYENDTSQLGGTNYIFLIICGICKKKFKRSHYNFIKGKGQKCKNCCVKERNKIFELSFEECISKIKDKGNLVDEESSMALWDEYESKGTPPHDRLFYIKCSNCDDWFWVTYTKFIEKRSPKRRCDSCAKSISTSEKRALDFLKKNNFVFKKEKTFNDCIFNGHVKFDYFINDEILLELDGKQHFEPATFGGITIERAEKNLKEVKNRDSFKNKYCIKTNIPLIRIPYWDFYYITNILTDILINKNFNSKYIIQNNEYFNYVEKILSGEIEKPKIINKDKQKSIICIDNGLIFESLTECANKSEEIFGIKLNTTGISRSCLRDGYKYKGFSFKFYNK